MSSLLKLVPHSMAILTHLKQVILSNFSVYLCNAMDVVSSYWPSSGTAGIFDFMNKGENLKVDFPTKTKNSFLSF